MEVGKRLNYTEMKESSLIDTNIDIPLNERQELVYYPTINVLDCKYLGKMLNVLL